ncbi:MAG: hypothetical protein PCFJNLEI_02295 [Verrucomicrobiae bacterium]|nr:hypothetical protein [Verrucomicrobiae bacterium]
MGRSLGILIVAMLVVSTAHANWAVLNRFQETITRAEFDALLTTVYCPSGALTNYLTYTTNAVTVFSTPAKTNTLFTLRFGTTGRPQPATLLRKIVLDPGHIGGEWARMEERYFVRGKDRPVQEAVLNLTVARLLRSRLQAAGVTVFMTKDDLRPVTTKRPDDFRDQVDATMIPVRVNDSYSPLEKEAALGDTRRRLLEQLFYRGAEIIARAKLINDWYEPDLTICLHFNAVEWNERYELVDDNRLVVFVHGNYLPGELTDDVQKLRLFAKLLERSHAVELAAAESVATALAQATKLPAVQYAPGAGATRVGTNAYIYARNLAANRLINGPVIFLEPYYMNNKTVYQRIQLGDYDGEKIVAGQSYRSIFREYADAVVAGLRPFLAAPR